MEIHFTLYLLFYQPDSGPLLNSKFRAYKMTRENLEMPINAVTYAVDTDVKYSSH